jgi:hypothetical protein
VATCRTRRSDVFDFRCALRHEHEKTVDAALAVHKRMRNWWWPAATLRADALFARTGATRIRSSPIYPGNDKIWLGSRFRIDSGVTRHEAAEFDGRQGRAGHAPVAPGSGPHLNNDEILKTPKEWPPHPMEVRPSQKPTMF